jgi:Zn-dependent protease with chaperone function
MTTVPHSRAETASVPPRPRVLAMPSPTVSRFLVLVAALLSAGLFVGTWVHNQTGVGADWLDQVRECQEQRAEVPPGADPAEALAAEESFLRCAEGAQQRLALFALGGVAGAAVAGLAVLAMVPTFVQRRRRLRPAGEKLAAAEQRVTTLAGESGLRRAPRVLVGPSTVRDAFSFGLPGRYRVVLPPALAIRSRDRSVFDPLVRHELAHLARHDVLIAWSARAVWYALLPMLAAPVVWGIVRADLSLLPSYAWRAALLVAVAFVASASILRSREYDADLTSAATAEQRTALAGLLGRAARPRATGWRRIAAYHPDRDHRIAALEQPGRIARISILDGALAGFLASLTALRCWCPYLPPSRLSRGGRTRFLRSSSGPSSVPPSVSGSGALPSWRGSPAGTATSARAPAGQPQRSSPAIWSGRRRHWRRWGATRSPHCTSPL